MALMMLQYIPDSDDPWGIVAQLMDAVPPGSYLSVSDPAKDIDQAVVAESERQYNERLGSIRQTRRTREEIRRFFTGLDMVEPGVVTLSEWRAVGSVHPSSRLRRMGRKP